MGYFENGVWKHGGYPRDESGRFVRPPTTYRAEVKPEQVKAGRFHLYVSLACPWAHRTLIARQFLGLEEAISVSVVDWYLDDEGWAFREREGATPDHILGHSYLRDVYLSADSEFTGRVTVPILWDREEQTIVNNESREILRMLATTFEPLSNGRELSPPALRDQIEETLDAIYEPINNGVYKAGFAQSQQAYEEAIEGLFGALDRWEQHLEGRSFLVGEGLSEADICLFTTLIRFDPVYFVHFKCSRRRIADYPNLSAYLRRLYEIPEIASTVDMTHIRHHYYESHGSVNPTGVVAVPTVGTIGI